MLCGKTRGDRRRQVFSIVAQSETVAASRQGRVRAAPVGRQAWVDRQCDLSVLARLQFNVLEASQPLQGLAVATDQIELRHVGTSAIAGGEPGSSPVGLEVGRGKRGVKQAEASPLLICVKNQNFILTPTVK